MVSHKYKCIFVEVPKTGSTSVRAILGKPLRPHLNLWENKRLMESYWTQRGGRKNRKFGFVRNPWDRVVSLYERTEAQQMRNEMTFDEFVDWIQYSSSTCIHSSPHRYQLDWFVDPNGKVLADFIGKFERLEEDWAVIAEKLGITKMLPHRRASLRTRHYTEYYTARTREVIATKFKVDIEHFGYEFAG